MAAAYLWHDWRSDRLWHSVTACPEGSIVGVRALRAPVDNRGRGVLGHRRGSPPGLAAVACLRRRCFATCQSEGLLIAQVHDPAIDISEHVGMQAVCGGIRVQANIQAGG